MESALEKVELEVLETDHLELAEIHRVSIRPWPSGNQVFQIDDVSEIAAAEDDVGGMKVMSLRR